MVVYVVPETRLIHRVTIVKQLGEMVTIKSKELINPKSDNKYQRVVLINTLFKLNKLNINSDGIKNCRKTNHNGPKG